jgi:Domain of unknown function (DUF4037)
MAARFPDLPYAAARLDGPPTIFLREQDAGWVATVRGAVDGPARITTVRAWVEERLRADPRGPLTAAQWLSFPTPVLRAIATGPVDTDATGELADVRRRLAWYPEDVWRYVLAAGWTRLGEGERAMPAAGRSGDELGSAVIGARLAGEAIGLSLLLDRVWPPVAADLGGAFAELPAAATLTPVLGELLGARTWPERQDAYAGVAELLLARQARLELTDPLPPRAELLPDGPFWGIRGDRVAAALLHRVADRDVARLAGRPVLGAVGQWTDGDAPLAPGWLSSLRGLYG